MEEGADFAPFHHTSVMNKAKNNPWNLLTQEDSSTRGVFWKVKESTDYLGDGERNCTGNVGRIPWFVLMTVLHLPVCGDVN